MSEKEIKDETYRLKNLFRIFFEGAYEAMPIYEYGFPVSKLEITDLSFVFGEKEIEMTITLCRPGLLIGKGGRTIDALEEFFNSDKEKPIKIKIVESNLWRR